MQSKLVKPWGPYGIGTVVADNAAEAKAIPGAVHVNPDRYAQLHESGHLASAEPSKPIPAEVKTTSDRLPIHDLPVEPSEQFFKDLRQSASAEIAQHGPSGNPEPLSNFDLDAARPEKKRS